MSVKKQVERRKKARFSVMKNVGEPIDLKVIRDSRQVSIPGFVLNLSAGGMGIVTLGDQAAELKIGTPFLLNLHLSPQHIYNVEGNIVSIQKSEKAKLHHENGEWYMGLEFTKIKASQAKEIEKLADDWNLCETKLQMNLPDVCYKDCSCYAFCEKSAKIA